MRKKITSVLLIMALVITLIPAMGATAYATSGSFEGVKYSILNGVLTVEKGTASTDWPAGSMGDEMASYKGWRMYSNDVKKVVIKDGVTNIASTAFSDMKSLTEVEIAGSVIEVGEEAFSNNLLLEEVTFGNGIETIGNGAFLYCSALGEVEIPSSVKSIGERAFSGCESLTKVVVTEGVETIGKNAFYYCPALTEVDLPTSIRWVGTDAFASTAILDAQCDEFYIVVDNVLIGAISTGFDANHPCVIPSGITCIADNAFHDIEIKGSLSFPDSLLYIGNYSFDGGHYNLSRCNKTLLELDLNNVVQIGNGAFRYWYCIDEVDLSKVTYIGDRAFYWCHDLESVTMAKRMEYLGEYIFESSSNVAFVTGPEYVERASGYAFAGGSTFSKDVYYDTDDDGMIYYNGILMSVSSTNNQIVIADGTYNIGSRAFEQYSPSDSSTVSVTIPESVKSIGYSFNMWNITDIYYAGSMKEWNAINFEREDSFSEATIHCAKSDAVTIEDCTVKVDYTTTSYTGKAKTPAVTVTGPDGKTLVKGTDYTVNYTNNVNVGTATITVTGQGEYSGTVEKSFTISKIAAKKVTLKLEYEKTNYNGKQKKPKVTLTDSNGRTLVKDTDYTVEYPKTLGAGSYTVTVTLKGNYTGTKTAKFTIVPAATSTVLTKLTGPTEVQVTWDLVPQASGYYVYYKKASSKSWSKAIDCGKTRKWTKESLKAGTKYNFKVVAYWKASDGKKYTSNTPVQSNIYTLKAVGPVTVKKNTTKKVKVTWKNINGESGYQVQKMTKKGGVYIATSSVKKGANVTSAVFSHAKGKTFYYRVRPYKTEKINGKTKTVYGTWTSVKGIKL